MQPNRPPLPRPGLGRDEPFQPVELAEQRVPLARALIGAAIVAALGAWVWGLVISGFEIEIGWLAWGIGWLVGFAFYKLGGAGGGGVLACGALALAAIFLGKYIGASLLLDDAEQQVRSMAGAMHGLLEEREPPAAEEPEGDNGIEAAAQAFAGMLSGEGGGADTWEDDAEEEWVDVDEEELEKLKAETVRKTAEAAANFEIEDVVSPWTVVKENLTFLDFVFVLLGVGTAMAVASGHIRAGS